ncbi:MAG: 3'(2'),5'-bisphosphate nucleotidase CysQ [Holosporales bacterium]|jgi:3'(2'), 5'-bisphosphate nucleotidase|nr:3'(2'),5'-bisphosphate nucleotidase CysQ [Holosporales bacterium]
MKNELVEIVQEAGKIIASYWGDTTSVQKEDLSPLTEADKASHAYLSETLPKLEAIPVVSEEAEPAYEVRKNYTRYWLVDPLDGTKGFLKGHDDFCVNVALIQDRTPIVGAIYAPILDALYYAAKGEGVTCVRSSLSREASQENGLCAIVSRLHHSPRTQRFLSLNAIDRIIEMSSALKFCKLATREADIYPRFEGSKEWDIAAGHLILTESGGVIIDLKTRCPPVYNNPSIRNNSFVAYRSGLEFENFTLLGDICAD